MNATALRLMSAALVLAFLAGCAISPTGAPGPEASAPDYRAGDRWVYRVQDGFRNRVTWEETWRVSALSPQRIAVSVAARGPTVNDDRTETWSAPGTVTSGAVFDNETRRFEPALQRFRFPLAPGSHWNERMRDLDYDSRPYGGIQRSVTVRGYERITTPAGEFDAIRLDVYMRLDDETFWRWPTECTYVVWYAPAVGMPVREEKHAYYSEKGGLNGGGRLETQRATVELIAYDRGR